MWAGIGWLAAAAAAGLKRSCWRCERVLWDAGMPCTLCLALPGSWSCTGDALPDSWQLVLQGGSHAVPAEPRCSPALQIMLAREEAAAGEGEEEEPAEPALPTLLRPHVERLRQEVCRLLCLHVPGRPASPAGSFLKTLKPLKTLKKLEPLKTSMLRRT